MFLDENGALIPELKSRRLQGGRRARHGVLGLETLLARYGTMKRETVMAPAIRLAEQGYVLQQGDIKLLAPRRDGSVCQAAQCRFGLPA